MTIAFRADSAQRRRVVTASLVAIVLIVLGGCDKTSTGPTTTVPERQFTFTHAFSYPDPQGGVLTAEVGLWMFESGSLEQAAIADWGGAEFQGKRLLEPVNVLWVDFAAADESEAAGSVANCLDESGFFGEIFHSSGYLGLYCGADTVWRGQYESDKAWVDAAWPQETNHGRIFPAFEATSTTGAVAFLTSGAFSRESEWNVLQMRGHDYVSFNTARDAVTAASGWSEAPLQDLGNVFPPSDNFAFSTGDHNGVRVFVKYD